MKRVVFLSAAGLLIAASALAEDFWVKKQYMQWTDEEVRKLMTNSPWAKDITVSAPLAAIGGRGRGALDASTPTDVEQTGGGGGRGRRRGGGAGDFADGGSEGGTQALLTLNVSWRSALPLRQALVRSRLGADAASIPSEAEELIRKDQDEYVVVVTGVPTALGRSINPETVEQTTMRAGKKDPVAAKSIDVQQRSRSVDLIIAFPKAPAITPEDKEVEFVLKLGSIQAKKKFNLKEMVYNGKLEL
jgi:hypothetical protein